MRPCKTRTGTPDSAPETTRPRWPGTVGAGKPGRFSKGTELWAVSRSANAPRPDPSTTATGEASDGRRRAVRAARAQARASSVQAATGAAYSATRQPWRLQQGGCPLRVLFNPPMNFGELKLFLQQGGITMGIIVL